MSAIKLESYADWKTCIEHYCGIPLTQTFVAARVSELSDMNHEKTRRFIETWGEQHRLRVLSWFETAMAELERANP